MHFYWRKKLGLDLPLFYFSLHSLSEPDTLYKVYDKSEKEAFERLIYTYGNWEKINEYFNSILNLESMLREGQPISEAEAGQLKQLRYEAASLKYEYDDDAIQYKLRSIEKLNSYKNAAPAINLVKENYTAIKNTSSKWKNFIPVISFYKNNQYHRWMFGDGEYSKGILRGDFGISYITKQPVSLIIGERIKWSLFFVVVSVVIAYLVSIPIGVKAGSKKDSAFDKASSIILFILYSLPVFWVATLLLMTFANQNAFLIFPASGVMLPGGFPANISFPEKIRSTLPYLILPTICYVYGSFAFLSRAIRVSMIEEINKDYIRTARAKGLPESKVIYKHGLCNALLPAITVLANFFPLVISGAVIIETIFTIPGMGFETLVAVQNQNYPMIIAILTITGILTLMAYLVSDILYSIADPRITFST